MDIDVFTGGYFQTNGYLLSHAGSHVLIDAPEGVADWLESREVRPDILLLTHLHYDHVVDAAAVRERFDCPLWAHSETDPDLTLETVLKKTIGWPFDLAPFSIDRTLAGESAIETGGLAFDLLHVPGHSPDSLCFAPRPADGETDADAAPVPDAAPVLFGGDVLFRGSIGRTDFPHGDHDLLLEGIREKLYALPGDTVVWPGHGPETTIAVEKASNPFVR